MSLVGSLEDLGLVDILQIVSLSRKSGLLSLRCKSGQGLIVFRDGLVQGASIRGGPQSLGDLLVEAGVADAEQRQRADALVREQSLGEGEAWDQVCELRGPQVEDLKREQVERVVMRMFGWSDGEFSFDTRAELPGDERTLLLESGLNTQYLAMEATRLDDEGDGGEGVDPADPGDPAGGLDEWFPAGGEPDEVVLSGERGQEPGEADHANGAQVPEASAAESGPESSAGETPARGARHVIVVDPELAGLEWFKASVEPLFDRVHIFQRCASAIDRIRQYLVRGEVPLVVIAEDCAESDPEARRIGPRLRALASDLVILSLSCEGSSGPAPAGMDGTLQRPAQPTRDPDRWHLHETAAERLRVDLEGWL